MATKAVDTREATMARDAGDTTQLLALAGMIGPVLFSLLVVLQDIIQYNWLVAHHLSPLTENPVSDNALGPYGYVQTANFFVLGLCILALAVGLHRTVAGGRRARLLIAPVFVMGAAFVLSVFTSDNDHVSTETTWHGTIHFLAFLTILLCTVMTGFTMWRRFRRDPRWHGYDRYSLAVGILAIPLLVGTAGLKQVIPFSWFYIWLLAVPFAWLEVAAIRLWTLTSRRGVVGHPSPSDPHAV